MKADKEDIVFYSLISVLVAFILVVVVLMVKGLSATGECLRKGYSEVIMTDHGFYCVKRLFDKVEKLTEE